MEVMLRMLIRIKRGIWQCAYTKKNRSHSWDISHWELGTEGDHGRFESYVSDSRNLLHLHFQDPMQ